MTEAEYLESIAKRRKAGAASALEALRSDASQVLGIQAAVRRHPHAALGLAGTAGFLAVRASRRTMGALAKGLTSPLKLAARTLLATTRAAALGK